MTSSPGPISIASSARTSASVPLPTPTDAGTPRCAAASSSKARRLGPRMKTPASSTAAIRSWSSGISGAYWALTSTSGTLGADTALDGSRAALPPPDEDEDEEDCDTERDRVIDEAEVAVELLVAGAERPARAREREAPGERARDRQHGVLPQVHARDARRNRHERAHDRRDAAEEH